MKLEIGNIESEVFDKTTREESYEMVDISNLEDDTRNQRRYIRGRKENYEMEE